MNRGRGRILRKHRIRVTAAAIARTSRCWMSNAGGARYRLVWIRRPAQVQRARRGTGTILPLLLCKVAPIVAWLRFGPTAFSSAGQADIVSRARVLILWVEWRIVASRVKLGRLIAHA